MLLTVAAAQGTVYTRFGSASQVTAPDPLTLMNLYWISVPGASRAVPVQSGLFCVYCDAPSVTALLGFQLPSAATLPVLPGVSSSISRSEPTRGHKRDLPTHTLTTSPQAVVTNPSKVTSTADSAQVEVPRVLCKQMSVSVVLRKYFKRIVTSGGWRRGRTRRRG